MQGNKPTNIEAFTAAQIIAWAEKQKEYKDAVWHQDKTPAEVYEMAMKSLTPNGADNQGNPIILGMSDTSSPTPNEPTQAQIDNPVFCTCGFNTPLVSDMEKHMVTEHSEDPTPNEPIEDYKCPVCGATGGLHHANYPHGDVKVRNLDDETTPNEQAGINLDEWEWLRKVSGLDGATLDSYLEMERKNEALVVPIHGKYEFNIYLPTDVKRIKGDTSDQANTELPSELAPQTTPSKAVDRLKAQLVVSFQSFAEHGTGNQYVDKSKAAAKAYADDVEKLITTTLTKYKEDLEIQHSKELEQCDRDVREALLAALTEQAREYGVTDAELYEHHHQNEPDQKMIPLDQVINLIKESTK